MNVDGGMRSDPEAYSTGSRRRLDTRWWILGAITLWILYIGRSSLAPFVIAAIFAYVFSPLVTAMQLRVFKRRWLAVLVFYLITVGPTIALLVFLEPMLAREITGLGAAGPNIVRNLFIQIFGAPSGRIFGAEFRTETVVLGIQQALANLFESPSEAVHIAEAVTELFLKTILVLILVFYFLLDAERFGRFFIRFAPPDQRDNVRNTAVEIHMVLGRYLRGQLLLIFLMSVITWIGLAFVFHLPYALALGIMTGVLEVLPLVGPVVAGGIAAAIALVAHGPQTALWVVLFYFVMRQLEDQLIMPIVVGHSVELHPVATIFAVLVGGALAGFIGLVLAVPVAAAIKVVLDRWLQFNEPIESEVAVVRAAAHAP